MKKYIIYPLSGIVPAIATGLIVGLAAHAGVVMSLFCAGLACASGILIARLVVALVGKKKLTDSFIASEVWYAIDVALLAWFIFNQSYAMQTTLFFGILCATVNAFCFRFIAGANEVVVATVEEPTKKEKIAKLAAELRYKFLDDGKTPNLDAPLCLDEDGKALTPDEADAKGLGAKYAEAIEYIKTIVK